jgi:hypothetical protein
MAILISLKEGKTAKPGATPNSIIPAVEQPVQKRVPYIVWWLVFQII